MPCPSTYYGIAKYSSERLLEKSFSRLGGSSLVILRPPAVYGPGESIRTYSPSGFSKSALENEKIMLWGDGTERREFIFVGDIAKLVHYFTFREYHGILNIASGTSYTFRDSIEIISELLKSHVKVSSRERTKSKVNHGFDNGLLRKLAPGFRFTPLKEGIRRTLEENKNV